MTSTRIVKVIEAISVQHAMENAAVVNKSHIRNGENAVWINERVVQVRGDTEILQRNQISLSSVMRKFIHRSIVFDAEIYLLSVKNVLPSVNVSIDTFGRRNLDTGVDIDQIKMSEIVVSNGQSLLVDYQGTNLLLTVSFNDKAGYGLLSIETAYIFKSGSSRVKLTNNESPLTLKMNVKDLKFGGLTRQFQEIYRRAFVPRMLPPEIRKATGSMHAKGVLLFGPPGTGKTLMVREIAKLVNSHPPKIVNGPEILSKWHGESEKNIRELFADAEAEQNLHGDVSGLHIIVFDEFDAICRHRGSNATSNVGDQIVNQLLSILDGVNQLNNILVFGLTNRKDLIDRALIRPGRFEVHVEIPLPDYSGRVEIFNIHTRGIPGAEHVDASEIAKITRNYSGAEIAGVVRSAVTIAQDRYMLDPGEKEFVVDLDCFLRGVKEITPMMGRGLVDDHSMEFVDENIVRECEKIFEEDLQVNSISIIGDHESGKTSTAIAAALKSDHGYVKMYRPENFFVLSDVGKLNELVNIFQEAYQSRSSVLIFDDIDDFLGGNDFLHALEVLSRRKPVNGCNICVIVTSRKKVLPTNYYFGVGEVL